MSVAFKELAGSPLETYGPEGMKAQRRLLCAWDDRDALVQELLGDGYEFGGSGRTHYPGKTNIVALQVRVEAFADDLVEQQFAGLADGLNAYHGFAKVTVGYELLVAADRAGLPRIEERTFLTYRMEPVEETLTLPGDKLAWSGSPEATLPSDAVGTLRLPATRHRLTWHRVVNPPWTAVRDSSGALNTAEFLGAAAGTLLFEGAVAQREFLRISDLDQTEFGWRMQYAFRENPLVTVPAQPLLRSTDFARLLRFAEEE